MLLVDSSYTQVKGIDLNLIDITMRRGKPVDEGRNFRHLTKVADPTDSDNLPADDCRRTLAHQLIDIQRKQLDTSKLK